MARKVLPFLINVVFVSDIKCSCCIASNSNRCNEKKVIRKKHLNILPVKNTNTSLLSNIYNAVFCALLLAFPLCSKRQFLISRMTPVFSFQAAFLLLLLLLLLVLILILLLLLLLLLTRVVFKTHTYMRLC